MTRILVTGGTGTLGSRVTYQLLQSGYTVRVMSRNSPTANTAKNIEWAQADMETGSGLQNAVSGVDVVVHAASSPVRNTHQIDVDGTRQLLAQARTAGIQHFIYISIVGIDRIPYGYYQAKLATEQVVKESGVPWSTLRITQFHSFVDFWLRALYGKFPIGLLPGPLKFQSIDVGEAATQVVEVVKGQPSGLLPDVGGPEVLSLSEIVPIWRRAQGLRRLFIPFYAPGALASGFRQGFNTCPDHKQGKITWSEWVAQKYTQNTTMKGSTIHERQTL